QPERPLRGVQRVQPRAVRIPEYGSQFDGFRHDHRRWHQLHAADGAGGAQIPLLNGAAHAVESAPAKETHTKGGRRPPFVLNARLSLTADTNLACTSAF